MQSLKPLKIKCPHCRMSLMDDTIKIDNERSIKVNIEFDNKKGWLRLSALYGSYNIISEYEIPDGKVVKFFCPHCAKNLSVDVKCDKCNVPLVRFILEGGGYVSICSQKGCYKHSLEFEDVDKAMELYYNQFETYGSKITHLQSASTTFVSMDETKEIIRDGTFLYSYCPYCKKSLIKNATIEFLILNNKKEEGYLYISPYLNVFKHKSTVDLSPHEEVSDVLCPHCKSSLIEAGASCGECYSRVCKMMVSALSKLVTFYICVKEGCRWHGLSKDDMQMILLEDSNEW